MVEQVFPKVAVSVSWGIAGRDGEFCSMGSDSKKLRLAEAVQSVLNISFLQLEGRKGNGWPSHGNLKLPTEPLSPINLTDGLCGRE